MLLAKRLRSGPHYNGILGEGDEPARIVIWDLKKKKGIDTLDIDGEVHDMCWNQDGRRLLAFSSEGMLISYRLGLDFKP